MNQQFKLRNWSEGILLPFLCGGVSPGHRLPDLGGLADKRVLTLSLDGRLCDVDRSFKWTSVIYSVIFKFLLLPSIKIINKTIKQFYSMWAIMLTNGKTP